MKTKLVFLLILVTGCSSKVQIVEYIKLEMQYKSLANASDFIKKDQQGVLDYDLVSVFTETPTTRPANQEDRLKAVDLSYEMETLKGFFEDAAKDCRELHDLYKGKNIFNGGKRNEDIDLYKKFLAIEQEAILKLTNGVKPKEYLSPYLPKDLRELIK